MSRSSRRGDHVVQGGRARAQASLALWVLASVVPMAAYAQILLQGAIADTPVAYLVWIPVIAFGWSIWALRDVPTYVDDHELNLILGGGLLGLVGLILVAGPSVWSFSFIQGDVGLLLWPLWALALAWLLFGVGVTRSVWLPLAYLTLAWPPIFTWFVARTQGVLTAMAVRGTSSLAHVVPWLSLGAGSGAFVVSHLGRATVVYVTTACSGADSLLAVVILLPVLLTQLRGDWLRKSIVVAVAVLLALALNLARLGILLVAVHVSGPGFAFGVLHPVIGFILFAALVLLLAWISARFGLVAPPRGRGFERLARPGRGAVVVATAAALGVFAYLTPLLVARDHVPGAAIHTGTFALESLMPKVPGFRRQSIGRYDDQSILGPGAYSVAMAYTTPKGVYVMAELWETADLGALTSYTYHNCLLYHGSEIVAVRPFSLDDGTSAVEYAVAPAPQHVGGRRSLIVDVEWTVAVQVGKQTRYVRIALSAPREDLSRWAKAYRGPMPSAPGGFAAISVPGRSGTWPRRLDGTGTAVASFAVQYHRLLHVGRPTSSTEQGARGPQVADGGRSHQQLGETAAQEPTMSTLSER